MTPDLAAIDQRFSGADASGWRALVDKVLKGADFERRLVARTADGLRIEPLKAPDRYAIPILRSDANAPWRIAARVDHPEPADAGRLALTDLEGGAEALVVVGDGARSARGFGVRLADVDRLDRSLAGVMLDIIRMRLEPGGAAPAAIATALNALAERRGHVPEALAVDFGFDPIGQLMATGDVAATWTAASRAELTDTIIRLAAVGFRGPFLSVDVRPVSEAGGSEVQEIAVALATAAAYARLLVSAGVSAHAAFSHLSAMIAVDADQLLGIAKLRALRLALQRMMEAAGVTGVEIPIHAETAWRMLTRRDPAVNMLRATIATFAAGVGGADSITVLPHTSAHGLANAFARRVARNTQLVLLAESGLARVADPAAGSGSIEALTDDLARTGWDLFQEIERAGGIVGALMSGFLQSRIGEVRAKRQLAIATRRLPLTGTTEFPLLAEPGVDEAPAARSPSTATADPTIEPLPSRRLAEPFESLRDRADAYRATHGHAPRVFLAPLGPLAEHSTRTQWVANAIAAGGIEAIIPADGFTASSDVGRCLAESKATVACITGSDEAYVLLAEAVAGVLEAAGARHVLLAGRPGENEAALRAAGVDRFLFAGQDLVAALGDLLDELGA